MNNYNKIVNAKYEIQKIQVMLNHYNASTICTKKVIARLEKLNAILDGEN